MMDHVRPPDPMPRGIRILVDEQVVPEGSYRESAGPEARFVLERRWFGPGVLGLALFCLFWDGVLFVVFYDRIQRGDLRPLVFTSLHVGAGAVMTYGLLCSVVNRTRIAIEGGLLTVIHGPLPFPGNRRIPIVDLRQLSREEHRSAKGGRSYSVNALLATGKRVFLLERLSEDAQATYLEQALSERLGLAER